MHWPCADCSENQAIQEAYSGVGVAVLGASGFIGRWVARTLEACGASVTSIVRNPDDSIPGTSLYQAELSLPGAATDAIADIQPSIVFNVAGYGVDRSERNPDLARRLNHELPAEVARACGHIADDWRGQRLVHIGSALEYGTATGDLAESSQSGTPTELYGQTKLAGTRALTGIAKELALQALTARLFTVYGHGEHIGRLMPSLLEASVSGGQLPMTEGRQLRDFTYVEDVVEGLLRLGMIAGRTAGQPVNLATGTLTSVRAFATEVASAVGLRSSQLGFGEIPTRVEEMAHLPVNLDRLASLVDWKPPTAIACGARRTIAIFEKARKLELNGGNRV